MASGSSGRNTSNTKGFDFASDDILCSYEDYANQEGSNGNLSDPSIGANLAKVLKIGSFRVLKIWNGHVVIVWELAVPYTLNAEFSLSIVF